MKMVSEVPGLVSKLGNHIIKVTFLNIVMISLGTDHFTMNTHLLLLVTLTWLRIIDNFL